MARSYVFTLHQIPRIEHLAIKIQSALAVQNLQLSLEPIQLLPSFRMPGIRHLEC